MRVLNLYSGIGGNRKLWKDVDITAVEINPEVAAIYKSFFPNDEVLVDLFIPMDENLDAICYRGTWYIKTNAGNLQTAREILKRQSGDSVV